MYTKIGIPENNSLKSKIEELYEWCDKRDNDDELGKTYFNEPIDEDKLNKWEEANGVKIPETYKEWLRFTEKCLIDGSSAMFWGTDDFHHNFMPDNLTVIGEMSGDGEVVCFSNDNGEFMGYYEGDITYRTNDFSQVIDADTLNELKKDHAVVATLEDGYLEGGFGAKIAAYYGSSDMKVLNFGIKKEFIDRYDVAEVLKDNHLTPEQIAEDIAATL